MDREIRKVEKEVSKAGKDLKHIEKEDKKRDKAVEMGKNSMKKGC